MAEIPPVTLRFHSTGVNVDRDCGVREATLPAPLPVIGDDFPWVARDFEGFRIAMLEELAARFPERTRWTPADLEVVLVEVLAWALDQLSDMLDRVTTEAYLETARRPESVRRLLEMIGYDPQIALAFAGVGTSETDPAKLAAMLESHWHSNLQAMNAARVAGPRAVHSQRRMVSITDYEQRMQEHPLVHRSKATMEWNGSWHVIRVAVILRKERKLEVTIESADLSEKLRVAARDN